MKLTENTLISDNVSEAIYEIEGEGLESQSMLICSIKHGYEHYQVHLLVTRDKDNFIDYEDEMPKLVYSDGVITERA